MTGDPDSPAGHLMIASGGLGFDGYLSFVIEYSCFIVSPFLRPLGTDPHPSTGGLAFLAATIIVCRIPPRNPFDAGEQIIHYAFSSPCASLSKRELSAPSKYRTQ